MTTAKDDPWYTRELREATKLIAEQADLLKAYSGLCVAYRTGSRPSERLWDRLNKADEINARAREWAERNP